jgi:hypothetical protein
MDVQSVIDAVARTLIDEGTVRRWTEVELISHLNAAIRETITQKPSTYITNASVLLSAGAKQTVPTGCILVHDLTSNMGTDGSTDGRAVSLIDRHSLDDTYPNWRATAQATEVKHWMYDTEIDPKTFYVYPPSNGTGYVEMMYTYIPTELTDVDDTVPLDDMYVNALQQYMLFKCFEKDSDTPNANVRAQTHFQLFASMLGLKLQIEKFYDPNIQADPDLKERA